MAVGSRIRSSGTAASRRRAPTRLAIQAMQHNMNTKLIKKVDDIKAISPKDRKPLRRRQPTVQRKSPGAIEKKASIVEKMVRAKTAAQIVPTQQKKDVLVPKIRRVGRLIGARSNRSGDEERADKESAVKRHERPEKEERANLRRDRIWQNEEAMRARLLGIKQYEVAVPNYSLLIVRKAPRHY